jgi:hypothetical protein
MDANRSRRDREAYRRRIDLCFMSLLSLHDRRKIILRHLGNARASVGPQRASFAAAALEAALLPTRVTRNKVIIENMEYPITSSWQQANSGRFHLPIQCHEYGCWK